LVLFASHRAFIGVGPGIALQGSLRNARHRHTGIVYPVVGIHLLLGAVTKDADALGRPGRRGPLGMTNDTVVPFEPLAIVRGGHLSAGTHRTGLRLALSGPLADEVPEPLLLGARLGGLPALRGGDLQAD